MEEGEASTPAHTVAVTVAPEIVCPAGRRDKKLKPPRRVASGDFWSNTTRLAIIDLA
jgi:hypothetical protein